MNYGGKNTPNYVMNYLISICWIINGESRRNTPNHAEYGLIHADIGPFLDESGLNNGPKSAPGGDGWMPIDV